MGKLIHTCKCGEERVADEDITGDEEFCVWCLGTPQRPAKPNLRKRFVAFWKAMTAKGPCIDCGEPTYSMIGGSAFRHLSCWEKCKAKEMQEAEDKRQVELYKRAIAELERGKVKAKSVNKTKVPVKIIIRPKKQGLPVPY